MTAEARPDESTDGKVMHAAIQSGDHEAIARYRDAFPILEPFSDAAIQEGATPHNCSIALARERGFEGPYHLNRCFSENIPVAPRETFAALKEALKALDLDTVAGILDAFPYLARARVYHKELGVERGASLLHLAMPRWAKDGGDQTTDQHIAMASLLLDRGTPNKHDWGWRRDAARLRRLVGHETICPVSVRTRRRPHRDYRVGFRRARHHRRPRSRQSHGDLCRGGRLVDTQTSRSSADDRTPRCVGGRGSTCEMQYRPL